MKIQIRFWVISMTIFMTGMQLSGCSPTIKIIKPVAHSTVSSPVEVCFEVNHIKVEPAKNGVNPGAGLNAASHSHKVIWFRKKI